MQNSILQNLWIVFCLVSHISLSQGDLSVYYRNIHQAELCIMSEKYDSALYHYKKAAFQRSFFASDRHNACLSAIYVKDYKYACDQAEIMVGQGISHKYFYSEPEFAPMTTSPHWHQVEKVITLDKINMPLRSFIEDLLILDQKYRVDNVINEKKLFETDLKIMQSIDSLHSIFGYLNEELLGFFLRRIVQIGVQILITLS
jgi:hypothetical protein